jgi:hypothetical protein
VSDWPTDRKAIDNICYQWKTGRGIVARLEDGHPICQVVMNYDTQQNETRYLMKRSHTRALVWVWDKDLMPQPYRND